MAILTKLITALTVSSDTAKNNAPTEELRKIEIDIRGSYAQIPLGYSISSGVSSIYRLGA